MRILHAYKVFKPEIEGGIPEIVGTLATGLAARHDTEILVARPRGFGRTDSVDGVKVTRTASLGTLLSLPLAPTYPLHLWAKARQADILAVHTPFPLADPVAALLPRRTRLVIHWHAEIVRQRRLGRLLSPLLQAMLARADAIVVSDPTILESTPALHPHRERIALIPYGVALDRWRPRAEDAPAVEALKARHPILFVAVGRLVGYKGFDILIEAMARVPGHLVIIGEGDERPRFEALIAALGLEARITLLGRQAPEAIRRHLAAATAFVLPSISAAETFGLVQVEAMVAGRPVVNTALTTAVPAVARNGEEALTVPPGNIAALAEALVTLGADPALAVRLGAAGAIRAEALYGAGPFVSAIEVLYQRLCGG